MFLCPFFSIFSLYSSLPSPLSYSSSLFSFCLSLFFFSSCFPLPSPLCYSLFLFSRITLFFIVFFCFSLPFYLPHLFFFFLYPSFLLIISPSCFPLQSPLTPSLSPLLSTSSYYSTSYIPLFFSPAPPLVSLYGFFLRFFNLLFFLSPPTTQLFILNFLLSSSSFCFPLHSPLTPSSSHLLSSSSCYSTSYITLLFSPAPPIASLYILLFRLLPLFFLLLLNFLYGSFLLSTSSSCFPLHSPLTPSSSPLLSFSYYYSTSFSFL
ncbi:unnamed protein product [Acanthosepion pharaonis]|uniref:Uncharacterized protein n=1 Tax=Acanthosepion pharaonis TaxID=158019 RepID=A0A812CEW1_ACAPH|nr:unnamed protein product [Sepia pharaonis]